MVERDKNILYCLPIALTYTDYKRKQFYLLIIL